MPAQIRCPILLQSFLTAMTQLSANTPGAALSDNAALVANYRALSRQGVAVVMATVVETLGSTYRKAGARMLIGRDGRFFGLIGGGCFEGDLYEQTRSVFTGGEPCLLFYDMRAPEDVLWGLGLGCNGAVRLLLQRLAVRDDPLIDHLENQLAGDAPAVLATFCEGEHAGASELLDGPALAGERRAGASLPADWQDTVLAEARAVDRLAGPLLVTHAGEPATRVFYDYLSPPPRLLLVGAGADAVPILAQARQLGWRVVIADHRPAYALAERFPGAESVLHAGPEELSRALAGRRVDAAVLMTHNIDYDSRYLPVLARLPVGRYLGLLGPAARREALLERSGLTAADLGERLHGPVGLDIGGAAPESIALSLVSEIHAVLHERDARPLRDKHQPIQSRATAN